jgi:hypothetical protein
MASPMSAGCTTPSCRRSVAPPSIR